MESEDNTELENVSNQSRMKAAKEKHFGPTKKCSRKAGEKYFLYFDRIDCLFLTFSSGVQIKSTCILLPVALVLAIFLLSFLCRF